jgi:hypothetical protein
MEERGAVLPAALYAVGDDPVSHDTSRGLGAFALSFIGIQGLAERTHYSRAAARFQ